MRYFIAGQSDAAGVIGNDSADLNVYYELGWEVTFTNIIVKTMLFEGEISSKDTIVTHKDRSFFYSSLFDNVIDWQEFKQLNLNDDDQVVYLSKDIDKWNVWEPRINKEQVCKFNLIQDIEEQFNINKKFGIYCIRLRDHCSWRNSDLNVARNIINKLSNEYNFKVFITGRNTEELSNELKVSTVSLREFASLINSKFCKFCISPMSGIIQISNFCGHDQLHNLIFDHNNERGPGLENHPLFMGNNVNFKDIKNTFISGKETEEKIMQLLGSIIDET